MVAYLWVIVKDVTYPMGEAVMISILSETMILSGDSVRMEVGVLILMMLLIRLPTVPLCLPCFVLGSCLSAE
ncbi:hypothetical protein HZ326_5280 [Fusarium oxysporum f. sp. albedinis]|nr:hypothetical protein HZ326_5280 [Fusarium oxysporum f. sp. albedinis]